MPLLNAIRYLILKVQELYSVIPSTEFVINQLRFQLRARSS